MEPSSGPIGGACSLPFPKARFPLSAEPLREWRSRCQGRRLLPAQRTLDCHFASPYNSTPRERGPGSQGACPLAEYEAAPHARLRAFLLPPIQCFVLLSNPSLQYPPDSRPSLFAVFPLPSFAVPSPCFHAHSRCSSLAACIMVSCFGMSRGAAISASVSYSSQDAERSRPQTRRIQQTTILCSHGAARALALT